MDPRKIAQHIVPKLAAHRRLKHVPHPILEVAAELAVEELIGMLGDGTDCSAVGIGDLVTGEIALCENGRFVPETMLVPDEDGALCHRCVRDLEAADRRNGASRERIRRVIERADADLNDGGVIEVDARARTDF